jgi:hypothetical protein
MVCCVPACCRDADRVRRHPSAASARRRVPELRIPRLSSFATLGFVPSAGFFVSADPVIQNEHAHLVRLGFTSLEETNQRFAAEIAKYDPCASRAGTEALVDCTGQCRRQPELRPADQFPDPASRLVMRPVSRHSAKSIQPLLPAGISPEFYDQMLASL